MRSRGAFPAAATLTPPAPLALLATVACAGVARAREFFETHFDLDCAYARNNLAMLADGNGFELAVSNLFDSDPPDYPPDFHIGFVLSGESEVRAMYERLSAAGVPMKAELGFGGPNIYFMCLGPDEVPVEVRAPRDPLW